MHFLQSGEDFWGHYIGGMLKISKIVGVHYAVTSTLGDFLQVCMLRNEV